MPGRLSQRIISASTRFGMVSYLANDSGTPSAHRLMMLLSLHFTLSIIEGMTERAVPLIAKKRREQ